MGKLFDKFLDSISDHPLYALAIIILLITGLGLFITLSNEKAEEKNDRTETIEINR